MAGTSNRVRRGIVLALIGAICATSLVPVATSADTNLVIGGQAVVAYANGDQVRLRQDIGYESTVLANYGEGTWVTVLDGPFTDSEGNYWYQVSVGDPNAGGLTGYIVADYLALESGVSLETVAAVDDPPTAPAPEESSAQAPGTVIGIAYVAGTNGDGVRCRTGASATSPVITVVPEGSIIELTGVDTEGWQPINCAGNGGFISSQFVSYQAPQAEVPPADPVVDEAPPVEGDTGEGDTPAEEDSGEGDTPADNENPDDGVAEGDTNDSTTDDSSAGPVPAGTITGKMVVTGTNGDGVRCRARAGYDGNVITVLPEGVSVDLNGEAAGEWQPVYCAGTAGYVYAQFLGAAPSGDESTETGEAIAENDAEIMSAALAVGGPTATAVVSGTNGDGLRCRNGAGYSSATISVLGEGVSVTVRGDAQGDWLPVTCSGQDGWAFKSFLSISGSTAGDAAPTNNTNTAATGTAVVNSSGGLNCRTGGSMTSSVIMVLSNNSTVTLRSGSLAGWQAVVCGGQSGFAASQYLKFNGTSGVENGSGSNDSGSGSGAYVTGATLKISGTGGGGLRLRSAGSYSGSVLLVIAEGASVTVRSGSSGEWVAISYNGTNGFVHKDYVTTSSGSSSGNGSTTNPGSTGSTTTALGNGDHARVTASLNLRYSPSLSAGVAAVAPSGTVVLITGSASNGYYSVDWDGLKGHMYGDYLTKTTQALSERGGSSANPSPAPSTPGNTQSGSTSGNSIVSYAMRYIGYPYVWAAAGPSAFDCSGFIYWVVTNSTGKSIGRVLFTQISEGSAVSRSALQPGDLVFFQNTYQPGLSHGGIYIGNNQFIHASNPSTGVMISNLDSSYYASRWYGAVRL